MEQHPPENTEQQAAALRTYLAELDRALEQGHTAFEALQAHRSALLSQLKNARERAADLAWELEDLEQRLRELEQQREGPPDLLVEREVASIARRRATIEDQALAQMLLVDELAERWREDEQELAEQEAPWEQRKAGLLAERERLIGLLGQLR